MSNHFVSALNTIVIGALLPFSKKYPVLTTVLSKSKHPSSNWGFFMTVAGVGIYVFLMKISGKERESITQELAKFDVQMTDALNNLNQYLKTRRGADLDLRAAIGFWVLWNITGNPPSQDESRELAPAIGAYLQNVIGNLAG